jgi:hypothetical protein
MKSLYILAAATATLAAGVLEPRPGLIAGAAGSVREIRGVAGSFVSRQVLDSGALAAASSGALSVVKLENELRVDNEAAFDAPSGIARIGFSLDGRTAFAFFPGDGSFASITASGSLTLPLDTGTLGGGVVALAAATSDALDLYVTRDDGLHAVRARLNDGGIESDMALGFTTQAVIALPRGVLVYGKDASLIILDGDGAERTLEIEAPITYIGIMGAEWVHVRAGDLDLAVRIGPGRVERYFLPATPASEEAPQ